jgi:hypothetical protein
MMPATASKKDCSATAAFIPAKYACECEVITPAARLAGRSVAGAT